MGSGSWSYDSFRSYTTATKKGATLDDSGTISSSISNQEIFKSHNLDEALDPKNVIRECRDSEEHPNTFPVILALDVTGSMGDAATEIAKKLNVIMTKLYEKITDVEFMIMGIGDFSYDRCPLQVSQFESDIRIAEQMDKVYFEFGGGGNDFESYSSAWLFGSRYCKLDCWDRGKKGIIITIGDECCNPYIPSSKLERVIGDAFQGDIETNDLYKECSEKYDIYHLDVKHRERYSEDSIDKSWKTYLDDNHYIKSTINSVADDIVNIIINASNENTSVSLNSDGISW